MNAKHWIAVGAFALALAPPRARGEGEEGASAKKYEEIAVEKGGSIKGRVTFKGSVPTLKLAVTADPNHCAHDAGGERPSPRLKVGADGGVAETVVFIRGIEKGKPLAELKGARTLDQKDCSFAPFVQVVPFKQTLKIVNSDPLNHNIHARIGAQDIFNNAMPNTGFPEKKDELEKRMIRAGVVALQCDVHAWMTAYVVVARHPYYAVTCEDGTFELKDVPPGDYEVVAWHPAWEGKPTKDSTGKVVGYSYPEPIEKIAKVKVEAGGAATADFVINE